MIEVEERKRHWPRWWRRLQVGARRANFFALLGVVAVVAFLVMSGITISAFLDKSGGDRNGLLPSNLTATLLVGMLVPALTLLVLLGRYIALRRAAESIGGNGRMHVRLVFIFSLIAAIPTLLVVIFASWLFQSGVEFWFSDSSRGLLENANKLARGYYEQVQRDVAYESTAMAQNFTEFLSEQPITSPNFPAFYGDQVYRRKLTASALLQKAPDGKLRTLAVVDPAGDWNADKIPASTIKRIDAGEPMVVTSNANKIEAVLPLSREAGVYLYNARTSDLLELSQGQRAENIVQAYEVLTSQARVLQLRFNVALFIVSLVLVGLSVWFALRFADRQVKPIYELVDAARRVGAGNYQLRIGGRTGADEIGMLNRAFNRMTGQIDQQTQELRGTNLQLEERRAFIEAVLASVTSGIISLDAEGRIMLMNATAQRLLLERPVVPLVPASVSGVGPTDAPSAAAALTPVGQPFAELAPQMATLLGPAAGGGIVQYSRGGELLTLAVKTAPDASGHVITFEDITRQLVDQRTAAWSDVARRIAHEIKNPLTPIQLATERLSRRYRRQITTDPELFEDLTRTIIRQVGDLRKMVDEFSSFARLPKPVFRAEDPVALTRQALFLQEVARPDIDFAFDADADVGAIDCDRHQFGQAMTNVLKNAVEAIETRARDAGEDYRGKVAVAVDALPGSILVRVTDNGVGLTQDRERIIEPYVTTREKGTGLGLAIVNKIIEEHGGEMAFTPAEGGGTQVTMRFAVDPLAQGHKPEAAE